MDAKALVFRVLFAGSVAKIPEAPNDNEDAYGIDPQRGLLALSDGASESFDPKRWAKILVDHFLAEPDVSLSWLDQAITGYMSGYNREHLSWSGQIAFDRGSFATLLGIYPAEGGLEVLAIGDTLAVLMDGQEWIDSFPYQGGLDFLHRPLLLGTSKTANIQLLTQDSASQIINWPISNLVSPVLLCMTDALGAWLLDNPQERSHTLLAIQDESDFYELVKDQRGKTTLKQDDTTLLMLAVC